MFDSFGKSYWIRKPNYGFTLCWNTDDEFKYFVIFHEGGLKVKVYF